MSVACSSSADNQPTAVDNLAVDNLIVNDTTGEDPALQSMLTDRQTHNYADEENGVYSYIAAISEDEAKQGKAAGDVLLFAFRGVSDGKYTITRIGDDGRPMWDSECSKPCRVVKTYMAGSVTRRAYTPDSLIGAAFEDAFNGQLKVKPKPPSPAPSTTSDYYGSSEAQSTPILPSGTAELQSLNEEEVSSGNEAEPL